MGRDATSVQQQLRSFESVKRFVGIAEFDLPQETMVGFHDYIEGSLANGSWKLSNNMIYFGPKSKRMEQRKLLNDFANGCEAAINLLLHKCIIEAEQTLGAALANAELLVRTRDPYLVTHLLQLTHLFAQENLLFVAFKILGQFVSLSALVHGLTHPMTRALKGLASLAPFELGPAVKRIFHSVCDVSQLYCGDDNLWSATNRRSYLRHVRLSGGA